MDPTNRLTIGDLEITDMGGKLWIYDRAEGVGWFVGHDRLLEFLRGEK